MSEEELTERFEEIVTDVKKHLDAALTKGHLCSGEVFRAYEKIEEAIRLLFPSVFGVELE